MNKFKQLIETKDYDSTLDFLKNSDMHEIIKDYNLGFVQFKQGHLVKALFRVEKAKMQGLFSDEVDSALAVLKNDLGIKTIEEDNSFVDDFMLSTCHVIVCCFSLIL